MYYSSPLAASVLLTGINRCFILFFMRTLHLFTVYHGTVNIIIIGTTRVVHHLMIIGEASSRMSQETKEKYPDLPWVGTIDVRNIITHEYFRVDLNIIWIMNCKFKK